MLAWRPPGFVAWHPTGWVERPNPLLALIASEC
jgi:hypothetical protein